MKTNTAVILAGGKSSRMGFDKQFLKIDGITILDKIVKILEEEFEEIIVVSNKSEYHTSRDYMLIEDEIKDCGPLGGIHAGLKQSSSKYTYFIACDMPNVNLEYIRYMKALITESNIDICVAKNKNGRIEPLNGFYSKEIITEVETQIANNDMAIYKLFDIVKTLYIDYEKVQNYQEEDMFFNLNTPEDLKNLKLINKNLTK